MDSQPKYHEYKPGGLFRDGTVLQAPPAGTVARDDLALNEEATQKPAMTARIAGARAAAIRRILLAVPRPRRHRKRHCRAARHAEAAELS